MYGNLINIAIQNAWTRAELSFLCTQIYRGRLRDGSYVAIRCLKLKRSNSIQNFMHQIEIISKLRHQHLVSALGHCFECYLDDSSVSRIFLVFEYVPNGTLRSWISGNLTIISTLWIYIVFRYEAMLHPLAYYTVFKISICHFIFSAFTSDPHLVAKSATRH